MMCQCHHKKLKCDASKKVGASCKDNLKSAKNVNVRFAKRLKTYEL